MGAVNTVETQCGPCTFSLSLRRNVPTRAGRSSRQHDRSPCLFHHRRGPGIVHCVSALACAASVLPCVPASPADDTILPLL